ncbi:MAG TPA: FAD:protein FMN transferase [Anaerolineales bacterium]
MTDPNSSNTRRLNRRGFLKIVAAAGLTVGLGAAAGRHWLEAQAASTVQETRLLMGTVINLTVFAEDPQKGQAAVQATFEEMGRLVQILDHRSPAAALGQLNRQGFMEHAPAELVEVVKKALEIGTLTDGAFDVTVKPVLDAYAAGLSVTSQLHRLVDYRQVLVQEDDIRLGRPGMAITLDGLAKGRVVDGGVAVLRRLGFENVLVEAGGDLLAQGTRRDGAAWEVGIVSPRSKILPGTIATIPVERQAVATSGDYLNSFTADFSLNHIIDPRSLSSPRELASATVIAPTVMEADALSTALMVLGSQAALALVDRLPQIEAMLVDKEMKVYRSVGFPR